MSFCQVANFLFVLGTRPEAIKLAPLILEAKKDPLFGVFVCSTGQHREMLRSIFPLFDVQVDFDLDLMAQGQTLSSVARGVIDGLGHISKQRKYDAIVVQGDTTTCMAASLFGFYEQIPVIHIEAGLRSGDLQSPFPEEFNRRVTALASALHFAPTDGAKDNLAHEGVDGGLVHVSGNTGIDALVQIRHKLESDPVVGQQMSERFSYLDPKKKLILVTCHRRESFGEPLDEILQGLLKVAERPDIEIVLPLHMNPNVRRMALMRLADKAQWVGENSKGRLHNIWLSDPLDYLPFVYMMNRSHLIITDSGGVQEEAPTFGKPILVAREKTERAEAIDAGNSKLVPLKADGFAEVVNSVLDDEIQYRRMAQAQSPFGDGRASQKICQVLRERFLMPDLGAARL